MYCMHNVIAVFLFLMVNYFFHHLLICTSSQVFKDHPLMEPLDYCATIYTFGETNFTSNALDVYNETIVDKAVSSGLKKHQQMPKYIYIVRQISKYAMFHQRFPKTIWESKRFRGSEAVS
jgi:hypothetical protein